ncbi:ATP-dependent Lhr-like helicase [Ereboglobus sp. PH5-10]|uniref:DEAD/DEAH box helicase n=1 Tax=Ereboglobus sp. PH5-10 TaxID=2940629 RepID=UPI0024075D31|nr:DEAD/DEAH box helicase [Ereboglobus sp. PH5-10]MDF9826583.1 ATP-dependent Lhr-like helicase [Ereboglobus sp. PH5-10]
MRWQELNPVQRDCILAFNKSDAPLIITAPTAGGKTEAAFLPILSRIVSGQNDAVRSIRALYVGPLKALINDQFSRLERICEHAQIPVHRWHGDVSATEKKDTLKNPGGVLLITPESIEALFLRRGREIPALFAALNYVVIDELHAFLENVRGIHLRSLLSRIAHHAGCRPRLLGLSATLGDYAAARAFISPDAPASALIIESTGQGREIRLGVRAYLAPEDRKDKQGNVIARRRLVPEQWRATLATLDSRATTLTDSSPSVDDPSKKSHEVFFEHLYGNTQTDPRNVTNEFDDIAADICRHFRKGTNLIFGNAKRSIELVADTCHQTALRENWPVDPFHVHHGSLSKDERESVEAHLKNAVPGRPATAFCSSTLEMGIDIGNIRAIGQIDPPWSVSSMVQRLGRSGRRADEPSILRLYTRDSTPTSKLVSTPEDFLFPELLRSVALVRLLMQKWLEPPDSNRMHLSTLVHQILSYLTQTGGMRAINLHDALLVRGPFRNIDQRQFITLLRGLKEQELIEQMTDGTLILGLAGENITRDRTFYAAFQSTEEFNILHNDRHLGMLAADLVPPIGENIILGGRRWEVVEIITDEKRVHVKSSTNPKLPYFRGNGGNIADRVVCEMRNALNETSTALAWLDTAAQTLFDSARDLATRWQIASPKSAGILIIGNDLVWFPWRGTKIMQTLALLAKHDRMQTSLGQFTIHYKNVDVDTWRAHISRIATTTISAETLSPLLPMKQFEKFDEHVPEALLDMANARERLDMRGACSVAVETAGTWQQNVQKE